MTGRDHDDRLWDLPRVETQDDGLAPPDAVLAAYRSGALPPGETTRIEWRLAGSRRGRARLAELAGIKLEVPAARRLRRTRLAAALLAAAASIGIAALLIVGRGRPEVPATRPIPEFELRVEGLASARGVPGEARAYASQRVRVLVEPRGDAVSGLTFAAYRLDANGLTRLEEPREIGVVVERGSATLTAEAGRLVGPAAGTRSFFVVAARAAPPGRLAAPGAAAEAALSEATGGRVYQVSLTIVDSTEGAP
jgi:hypothetical protein